MACALIRKDMIYYKFYNPESIYYFCEIDYVFKTEQWKNIPDYVNYEVSDLGRIKSNKIISKPKILTLLKGVPYLQINLCKKGKCKSFPIHRLVAISFLNHKPCGLKVVVDHKDNDPFNNKLSNIQLISHRENNMKDRKSKYSKLTGVAWDKYSNRFRPKVLFNGKYIRLGSFKCELKAKEAYDKKTKEIIELELPTTNL